MNQISGYLELNGSIYKISSYEDIQAFLSIVDTTACEPTEEELDKLCTDRSDIFYSDDCGIKYGKDPFVLWNAHIKFDYFENYRILDGTIAIHNQAFYYQNPRGYNNIATIKSIYLPDSIVAIGEQSFYGLITLNKIFFSNSLLKIGASAFRGCTALTDITLPRSLKYIGSFAFCGCKQLQTIRFMSKPENLGSDILSNCDSLERIEIPVGSIDYFVDRFYPLDKDLFVEK